VPCQRAAIHTASVPDLAINPLEGMADAFQRFFDAAELDGVVLRGLVHGVDAGFEAGEFGRVLPHLRPATRTGDLGGRPEGGEASDERLGC